MSPERAQCKRIPIFRKRLNAVLALPLAGMTERYAAETAEAEGALLECLADRGHEG